LSTSKIHLPPRRRRFPKPAVAGISISVIVVLATVALPAAGDTRAPGRRPAAVAPLLPRAAWLRIASQLKGTVPARLLLGAEGDDAELDARLATERIDRADFQKAAAAVRREVSRRGDDDAQGVIAASAESFPLPEGFEIHDPAPASARPRTPSFEAARALVLELTARLRASDPSEEDR
jgi:hypothetical protein